LLTLPVGILLALKSNGGIEMKTVKERYESAEGAIGYAVLWFMGVPASVLFAIFILRGCH